MERVRMLCRTVAVALAVLGVSLPALAQSTTGRISGSVKDAQHGVLPGVSITVTEARTGLTRTTSTGQDGAFVFVSLPGGTYTVTAELTGFKKAVRAGYELGADGRLSADFTLGVGAVNEVIEVTVAGETVNTVSGEIARVVDRQQVQGLALNGRNYMQLATLIPGSPTLTTNALDIMTGLAINTSVNGSRTNASLLMVDGGFNADSGSNNSQISNVGIDFIQEVSIKTSNFSAEYGRNSGAAINVVTRNGTNTFHGSAYEYNRDESFDANDYFNNARNVARPPLSYNDFGWSLGGPVKSDKLFFFAGQEWKRIRRFTSPQSRTLPTRAMRSGNFSGVTTVLRDPLTGQPFPGNIIPASRITADGRAFANLYTQMEGLASSYTDTPTTNNSSFQGDNPFDFRQDLLRLDWQASPDHRITARFIRDDYNLIDPYGTFITSQLPTIPTDRSRPGRNYQVTHTWSMSSNLINEFKVNAAWNSQRIPPEGELWKRETYGFAFPQLFTGGGRFENSIPDVDMTGYATFRGAAQSLISPTTDIAFSNNLTWLRGSHTFKFGGLVVRNRKDQNGRSQYAGFVDFNPTGNPNSTGNAFADALLGNFRTYREAQSDPVGFFRFWQYEGYVSDNWRVSRKLSLELGLRYQWHVPTYTQANNMASFDPARYDPARAITVLTNGTLVAGSGDRFNGMVRAGDGVPNDELFRIPNGQDPFVLTVPAGAPRGFYDAQGDLAPRFSFAWKPTGNENLAVRGGLGLFYDRPEGNLYFSLVNAPPYSLSSEYQNGNLAQPGGGTVPALAPVGTIDSIDPAFVIPRTWQWSTSVQKELGWGIFGEIGYVGSKGQNLVRQPDINQPSFEALAANAAGPRYNTNYLRPYKGFSQIRMRLSDADSSYHAAQLFLSRRKGTFLWTVSYTLGRSVDNGSGNGDNAEDYLNKDYNQGPSDFDRKHIFVATYTWKVPFFGAQQGLGRILGGWEVSGITRYQSGAPLTIMGNTSIGARRADYLGTDAYADELINPTTGVVQWLNRAAFAVAPESQRGNSKRGQFRGPSFQMWDLSLRKQFRVKGDLQLQFQADLFNVLNQTNFNAPGQLNVSNADFGQITSAAPPRNVQLGVRLQF
jgi:Carboxypeptidase regulatory-like domain